MYVEQASGFQSPFMNDRVSIMEEYGLWSQVCVQVLASMSTSLKKWPKNYLTKEISERPVQ